MIFKEAYLHKKYTIVGASSVILPGVRIEEGVSVGALSLVTKPTEAWEVST
jgi:galactoside O-acetyltransferase